MLAPKDQITSKKDCCYGWLEDAGTRATSRTLKVKDAAAYNALANNPDYLPDNWKKDAVGTTVQNASNNPIK